MKKTSSIRIDFSLSCGCTLTHTHRFDHASPPPQPSIMFRSAGEIVAHWLRNNLNRHQCELVSRDNPNGFAGEAPRKRLRWETDTL